MYKLWKFKINGSPTKIAGEKGIYSDGTLKLTKSSSR
jgi:hypothetical protein